MRITVVASLYASDLVSGENLAVSQQVQALEAAGHDVDVFLRSTDDASRSASFVPLSALRVATGFDFGGGPAPRCRGADHLLLVNNLFPNFGTRWVAQWPGPVVTMVHNYRFACANGLLLRDGRPCAACLQGSRFTGVRYGCYRGSKLATLPVVLGSPRPAVRQPALGAADVIVAQTDRVAATLTALGTPTEKISVVPGLLPTSRAAVSHDVRRGWAFIGRLTPEKGLQELLLRWPDDEALDIIGDGPERSALENAGAHVRFLGARTHTEVLELLSQYEGLIFPGLCWEGAHPMVVREALSAGTPVVAAVGSSAADLIQSAGGGEVFDLEDAQSLRSALDDVREAHADLGRQARTVAEEYFSQDRWLERMSVVFDLAGNRRTKRNR